jgi:hypothetical protein
MSNEIKDSVETSELTDAAKTLLSDAGSNDRNTSMRAQAQIAKGIASALNEFNHTQAVEGPIREGVLKGDIVSDIFVTEDFSYTNDLRIPLDLLAPGTEKDHVAYVIPDHGKIPMRRVEADYIQLNTYMIGSSIDCTRKFLKNARFDVLRRMIEVLNMSFVKKNNDDGWQTLLAAAYGRGIAAYDADAPVGSFTPKLVSLMKTVVRRNGGGNSTSTNRRKLTDLYMSPEAFEDMSAWGLNLVSDDIRSSIQRSEEGAVRGMYGVNFHDIDELGVGQEYQLYYTGVLNGALASAGGQDEELVIGLDLTQPDKSFIHPVSQKIEVTEDDNLHRHGLVGFYGSMEGGWACLDVRYILAGSF